MACIRLVNSSGEKIALGKKWPTKNKTCSVFECLELQSWIVVYKVTIGLSLGSWFTFYCGRTADLLQTRFLFLIAALRPIITEKQLIVAEKKTCGVESGTAGSKDWLLLSVISY